MVSSFLLAEFLLPLAKATDAGLVTGPGWRAGDYLAALVAFALTGWLAPLKGVPVFFLWVIPSDLQRWPGGGWAQRLQPLRQTGGAASWSPGPALMTSIASSPPFQMISSLRFIESFPLQLFYLRPSYFYYQIKNPYHITKSFTGGQVQPLFNLD